MEMKEFNKLRNLTSIFIQITFSLSLRKAYVSNILSNKPKSEFTDLNYSGYEVYGIMGLQYLLLLDFIQALVGATFDNDDRTASLGNIMKLMKGENTRKYLRAEREKKEIDLIEIDLEMSSSHFIKSKIKERNIIQFEKIYDKVISLWSEIENDSSFKKMKRIRNKIISHNEVRIIDNLHSLYNISDIKINWKESIRLYSMLEEIAIDIYFLVHDSYYKIENIVNYQERMARSVLQHIIEL